MQSQTLASAHVASSHVSSAVSARLEALQSRHEALSHKIDMEQRRPGTSDWYLRALKQQKLHLKEEIEGITGSAS